MNSLNARDLHSPGAGLASWYTPGRSDGFGDRLLMFDNTDAISLELLRFRRDLARVAGFENALRDGVDQLASFQHSSFAPVRAVILLDDRDLTLVSTHLPGQRLSELSTGKLRKGLHPAVVTWIVREVTPALSALQACGPGTVHGALSADRIVLTPEGRLCIVEHSLGSTIRRLGMTAGVFWRQFGLLAPVDRRGQVRMDPRTDVVQLGTIALSLLLGRWVTLHDFEQGLPALLDEFSAAASVNPSAFAAPLRAWLERALQLSPRPYQSAKDAQEALAELPEPTGSPALSASGTLELAPDESDNAAATRADEVLSAHQLETAGPLRTPSVLYDFASESTVTGAQESNTAEPPPVIAKEGHSKRPYAVLIAVTLGAVALVEGAILARVGNAPTVVSVAGPALPARPAQLARVAPIEKASANTVDERRDTAASMMVQASARQRSGGIRWSSPFGLDVFEGDRVVGSTADGPIVLTAGTHELDLVNASLGYRAHQTVIVRPGAIVPLTVTPPPGRININAQPWAHVSIDGNPIGDTPLANISVPLGPHTVTFQHPDLGERRETVTVRADAIARISTSFER
jgi:hypothetical protein